MLRWKSMLFGSRIPRGVRRHRRPAAAASRPLAVEPLEDRRLLTITVDTLVDEMDGNINDGDISLRDAIAAAAPGEVIDFSVSGKIDLAAELAQLRINKPLTIDGSSGITIDAGQQGFRVLNVVDDDDTILVDVTLRNITLQGGSSFDGGAINNHEKLTIANSILTGNDASNGGAIYNYQLGDLTIINSTLTGNNATVGGAIYNYGQLDIDNSTVSGNSASTGGGIANLGRATINHSTVTDNNATIDGAGVWNRADRRISINNSIVAGNDNSSLPDLASSGDFASGSFNLIGHATGLGFVDGESGNQVGVRDNPIDPRIADLGDFGGTTPTHALLADSLAVNAGDPAVSFDPVEFDQRGDPFSRVVAGRLDIGAFESDFLPDATNVSLTNGILAIGDPGPDSDDDLRLAIDGDDLLIIAANSIATTIPGSSGSGTQNVRVPRNLITANRVDVDTAGSDDKLTLDFTGGPLDLDVAFAGGDQATPSGDELVIVGGNFNSVVHTHTGPDAGTINLDGMTVAYAGLEPVDMSGNVIDGLTFNLPGSGDQALLEASGLPGVAQLRSQTAAFETTLFPWNADVTLNLGDDDASLFVMPGLSPTSSLAIDGQLGNDAIEFQGDLTLAAVDVVGADGGITDAFGADLNITGAANFDSGGGNTTLGGAETTQFGSLSVRGGDVAISVDSELSVTSAATLGPLALSSEMNNLNVDGPINGATVRLTAQDDLTIDGLITAVGLVRLAAIDGSIGDDHGGVDVVADSVVLEARQGIGDNLVLGTSEAVELETRRVAFINTDSGRVLLESAGPLTIDAIDDLAESISTGIEPGSRVLASSPLTIATDVMVAGDFEFTAAESAEPGDDLTILAGVTITGVGADVDLMFNAGDDFQLAETAAINTTGSVTVNVDAGAADAEGSTVRIAGGVAAADLVVNGGDDNDVFVITPGGTSTTVNGNQPAEGDPGVPPGDRLVLALAEGVTLDNNPATPDGTAMLTGAADVAFTSIERLVAIGPDNFGSNDSIAEAAFLGPEETVTLMDLSIHNGNDEDFFKIIAHESGKMMVNLFFDHTIGDLDLEVQDMFGNTILDSSSSSAEAFLESVVIEVVDQEMYFVRVFGVDEAINNYDLSLQNRIAPTPERPELHPDDDNGLSSADDITDVENPRVLIQADLTDFAAMGIAILSAADADAGETSGAAVEVFINGASQGFADAVGSSNTLFQFALDSEALADGLPITGGALNFITAAIRIFDGQLNVAGEPAMISGRTQLSSPLELRVVDSTPPQVNQVFITDDPAFDLFHLPPTLAGPTPPITSLSVEFVDFPVRGGPFDGGAVDVALAENEALYSLVGDAVGPIAIQSAVVVPSPIVEGDPATTTVRLTFAEPLPDDRITFTIFDRLTDPAGNHLDGESNAVQPIEAPTFPSGDGVAGGDFVASFTVDSRAEIGTWAASTVLIDGNGDFKFDPNSAQVVNRDTAYRIGFDSDYIFAGQFSLRELDEEGEGAAIATGFDVIAAYGRVSGNRYRWLIDRNGDGAIDPASEVFFEPTSAGINGYPVAGNFDGDATNGDEIGLFDGTRWYFDTDRNFNVSDNQAVAASNYSGYPISGDFNNDGNDDVATYVATNSGNDLFSVDINQAAGATIEIDGVADFSFHVGSANNGGFGFAGVRERPVAADFNADGIDDFGLWVPDGVTPAPDELAEWYLLVSGDLPATVETETTVLSRIQEAALGGFVPFSPGPLGNDLYAQMGNTFALPIAGNFGPPFSTRPTFPAPPGEGDGDTESVRSQLPPGVEAPAIGVAREQQANGESAQPPPVSPVGVSSDSDQPTDEPLAVTNAPDEKTQRTPPVVKPPAIAAAKAVREAPSVAAASQPSVAVPAAVASPGSMPLETTPAVSSTSDEIADDPVADSAISEPISVETENLPTRTPHRVGHVVALRWGSGPAAKRIAPAALVAEVTAEPLLAAPEASAVVSKPVVETPPPVKQPTVAQLPTALVDPRPVVSPAVDPPRVNLSTPPATPSETHDEAEREEASQPTVRRSAGQFVALRWGGAPTAASTPLGRATTASAIQSAAGASAAEPGDEISAEASSTVSDKSGDTLPADELEARDAAFAALDSVELQFGNLFTKAAF